MVSPAQLRSAASTRSHISPALAWSLSHRLQSFREEKKNFCFSIGSPQAAVPSGTFHLLQRGVLMGAMKICSRVMELILTPCGSPLLSVGCLPFLAQVFPEVLSPWLRGSAVPCTGSVGAVSSPGQPQCLLPSHGRPAAPCQHLDSCTQYAGLAKTASVILIIKRAFHMLNLEL